MYYLGCRISRIAAAAGELEAAGINGVNDYT
jgi:hypothetical protein